MHQCRWGNCEGCGYIYHMNQRRIYGYLTTKPGTLKPCSYVTWHIAPAILLSEATYPRSLNPNSIAGVQNQYNKVSMTRYLISREIGYTFLLIDCLAKADIDTSPLADRNNHAIGHYVISRKLGHVSETRHFIGSSENGKKYIYW